MGRIGDILTGIIDDNNGKEYTFLKVTSYSDGTTMDDSKVDNKIYIKVGNEYFKRTGVVDISIFAKGDYNPDTNTGTDDTAGWREAISILQPNETIYIPPNFFSKITDNLDLKACTSIIGSGLNSCIWVDLADSSKNAFNLPSTEFWSGTLNNFCVYGDAGAGRSILSSNYLLDFCKIDLVLFGGFDNLFIMDTSDPFGSLSNGIQNSNIRIVAKRPGVDNKRWPYSKILPGPARGFYQKGYVNATDMVFDFQIINGDGVVLDGNYSAANSSTLWATMQGCTGTGVKVNKTKGGLSIKDFYGEANGEDIRIIDSSDIAFYGRTFGNVFLQSSINIEIPLLIGALHADVNSAGHIGNTQADGPAVVSDSDNITTSGFPKNNGVTGLYSPTVKSPYDYKNFFVNGDFMRFYPLTNGSERPWGFDDTLCIATRTGDGMTDTTRTAESPYAVKIEARPSAGWHLRADVPLSLKGRLGGTISLCFKYKNFGYFELTNRLNTNYSNQNPLNTGIDVENGFKLARYSFKITQLMVDEGIQIRFNSNNGTTYISEVYCGFGFGTPQSFIPNNSNNYRIISGSLIVAGSGAPPATDPILNANWIAGDQYIVNNPTATGATRYVCITGGSSPVWRAIGTDIKNQTTLQAGANFNIDGTGKVGVLEAVSDGAGLAIKIAPGAAIRNGQVGSVQFLDLGNIFFRDGNGGAGGSLNVNKINYTAIPPDYADDAAAATGGIAVGETYRTGSILKTRVA